VKKQRIQSSENIAKEILEKRQTLTCPLMGQQPNNDIIELVRDPNEPVNEPFGWKKGTVRGMLAIWTTIGFLLITALIMFQLPLTPVMVLDMWKILAFVYAMVVGSYFYTRLKLNSGMFK